MNQHCDPKSDHQEDGDAVIKPSNLLVKLKLKTVAVMLSTQNDLHLLCDVMGFSRGAHHPLFMSRIYNRGDDKFCNAALVGPMVGAPYAVMVLESLIAGGVREVIYFGWCGAVSPHVAIGDILVPTSAFIDEGTSRHYLRSSHLVSHPSESLVNKITAALVQKGCSHHKGPVWSTDAIFRETKDKIRKYQTQKALAVEMEVSALFTVGNYRAIDLAAILVVSDELSTFKWRTGFRNKSFKRGRMTVCEVIKQLCQPQ
jgi:uridine phosphorylase